MQVLSISHKMADYFAFSLKSNQIKKFYLKSVHFVTTAALITNIPLISWGNEMKFTEKIEKELI
jgi:hypothetical protein